MNEREWAILIGGFTLLIIIAALLGLFEPDCPCGVDNIAPFIRW